MRQQLKNARAVIVKKERDILNIKGAFEDVVSCDCFECIEAYNRCAIVIDKAIRGHK